MIDVVRYFCKLALPEVKSSQSGNARCEGFSLSGLVGAHAQHGSGSGVAALQYFQPSKQLSSKYTHTAAAGTKETSDTHTAPSAFI